MKTPSAKIDLKARNRWFCHPYFHVYIIIIIPRHQGLFCFAYFKKAFSFGLLPLSSCKAI